MHSLPAFLPPLPPQFTKFLSSYDYWLDFVGNVECSDVHRPMSSRQLKPPVRREARPRRTCPVCSKCRRDRSGILLYPGAPILTPSRGSTTLVLLVAPPRRTFFAPRR